MLISVENNVKINVEDLNRSGARTVLFIHGWPLNHEMFEYQVECLLRYGVRCVLIDLRGYGNSDKPAEGYGYDRLSDDIHMIVRALDLKDFSLLGYSMGGAAAVRYLARTKTFRVRRLMLIAAACPSFTKRPANPQGTDIEKTDDLIASLLSDRAKTLRAFSDLVFNVNRPSEAVVERFYGFTERAALWSAAASMKTLRDELLTEDCKSVRVPTAIFHGTQDIVCPFGLAVKTGELIAGARVLPFENSGHGIFYQEKDKLNSAIMDFIM